MQKSLTIHCVQRHWFSLNWFELCAFQCWTTQHCLNVLWFDLYLSLQDEEYITKKPPIFYSKSPELVLCSYLNTIFPIFLLDHLVVWWSSGMTLYFQSKKGACNLTLLTSHLVAQWENLLTRMNLEMVVYVFPLSICHVCRWTAVPNCGWIKYWRFCCFFWL